MEIKKIQQLSNQTANKLIKVLPCYSPDYFVLPGNDLCITERQKVKAVPYNVCGEQDTIPLNHQGFAEVCETCPVLLTAYAKVFGK